VIYDLSPSRDKYYRQNGWGPGRNEIDPGVTCKPTSVVMALDIAGWPMEPLLSAFNYKQPEDCLTALCRSPEAEAYKLSVDMNLKDTPGNEVWAVIAWALTKLYGARVFSGPRWAWSMKEVLWGIAKLKRPFAASTWLTKGGHVVDIVGFETAQENLGEAWYDVKLGELSALIIDDPAGVRMADGAYDQAVSGYHTHYTIEEFMARYWRGTGLQIVKKEA
jgi:hypothetical protein